MNTTDTTEKAFEEQIDAESILIRRRDCAIAPFMV